jgi:hypothetical protein
MDDSMQYVITFHSRKKKSDEFPLKPPKAAGAWTLHSWNVDGKRIAVIWQAPEAEPKTKRAPSRSRSSSSVQKKTA